MLAQNKKTAIIGGGPGGLTLAKLLQDKGYDVTVYERDADQSVRQQGATLDLHDESGLKAMRAMGLLDAFKKHYRPGADKLRVVDSHLHIYYDDHAGESDFDFGHEHFRPEIDRGPLRDILIASLRTDTIVWNAKFKGLEPENNGWRLLFDDGQSAYADFVVAADGANSRIRQYLTDVQPIYSGITIVEGNIYDAEHNAPKLWKLVQGGKVFALGSEKSLILSAKGDGSLSFYTGTKESPDWVTTSEINFYQKESILEWFKTRFADWSSDWYELFETDKSYFVPRPQYHFPLDQTWKTLPNLTMLGDAAHRMPPYAGEGVNMAMLDALELAEALTGDRFDTTEAAVAAFEKGMCERMAEMTAITLESTENLHADGALSWLVGMIQPS
ncbi:tetracycline resistance protein [Dyadobacter beijingensis]|uniref:Flavin-dependent monooxygenase n=1 Tax=Dyadobacter beijingensis TaxID=365489 RepID=A0ABQ2HM77_9BACT|nr:NAD(P)/FAD-dependent oxidoreductase [Dyadobacter beijingensis]GGM86005.1 tetracycline resistance protein [Dyadobacter beijingensis]